MSDRRTWPNERARWGGKRLIPLPFLADFSLWGNGKLPHWFSGLTWLVTGGKAVNIPQFTELVTNGNMEIDANWANFNGVPTVNERSSDQAHGGTYSRKVQPSTPNSGIQQALTFSAGSWLRDKHWGYGIYDCDLDYAGGGGINSPGAWSQRIKNILGTVNANTGITFYKNTTNIFYVDDVSVAKLNIPSLFCTLLGRAEIDISASITITEAGNYGGVVARMDNKNNPRNLLIAYHDGTTAYLVKVVNGVRTVLVDGSVGPPVNKPYSPGAPLRILVYGNYALLKYDNQNAGSYVDVSSVGPGTLCGLFSTDPSVQFGSLAVAA